MEFWNAVLGLLRRKRISLPLLTVAATIGAVAYVFTPTQYVSSTTMVVTTPAYGGTLSRDPQRPTGLTNPLLNFDNGLKTTSAILIQAMSTPEVAEELRTVDGPTKVTTDDGSSNPNLLNGNGPFVYIVGQSTSEADALGVVVRAQQRIRQELVQRQEALGAPPETFVTLVDVISPTPPEVNTSSQIKVAAIASALTFVLLLVIAYGWQRRRSYRRRRSDVAIRNGPSGSMNGATAHRLPIGTEVSAMRLGSSRRARSSTQATFVTDESNGSINADGRSLIRGTPLPRSLGMRRPDLASANGTASANGRAGKGSAEEADGLLADR